MGGASEHIIQEASKSENFCILFLFFLFICFGEGSDLKHVHGTLFGIKVVQK